MAMTKIQKGFGWHKIYQVWGSFFNSIQTSIYKNSNFTELEEVSTENNQLGQRFLERKYISMAFVDPFYLLELL